MHFWTSWVLRALVSCYIVLWDNSTTRRQHDCWGFGLYRFQFTILTICMFNLLDITMSLTQGQLKNKIKIFIWIFFLSCPMDTEGSHLHRITIFPSIYGEKKAIFQREACISNLLIKLNCGLGEDSWESLGLQADQTSKP